MASINLGRADSVPSVSADTQTSAQVAPARQIISSFPLPAKPLAEMDFDERQAYGGELADIVIDNLVEQIRFIQSCITPTDEEGTLKLEHFLCDGIHNRFTEEVPDIRDHMRDEYHEGDTSAAFADVMFGPEALPDITPRGVAAEEGFRIAQVYVRGQHRYRERMDVSHILLVAAVAANRLLHEQAKEKPA